MQRPWGSGCSSGHFALPTTTKKAIQLNTQMTFYGAFAHPQSVILFLLGNQYLKTIHLYLKRGDTIQTKSEVFSNYL